MMGVQTNVVTGVEVTDSTVNDAPYLPTLAQTTARWFIMEEVAADKGYMSSAMSPYSITTSAAMSKRRSA